MLPPVAILAGGLATRLRPITEKVPSYKWVVEDLCPECTQHCRAENTKLVHTAAPNTGIPLPPTE